MRAWYKALSIKAVVIGGVVDMVATNVLMVPVAVAVFAGMRNSNLSPAAQTAAFTRALSADPLIFLAALLLGSAASVLGGWTAARIARRSHLLHGAFSSFACVGLGLYAFKSLRDTIPLWQHIVFLVVSPALGAAGGLICARHDASRPAASASSAGEAAPTAQQLTDPLVGVRRLVYALNRALLAINVLLASLFALVGILGRMQHNSATTTGGVILVVICLMSAALAFVGARHLRAGHARHWIYQAGSVALILIPVVAVAIPLLAAHPR